MVTTLNLPPGVRPFAAPPGCAKSPAMTRFLTFLLVFFFLPAGAQYSWQVALPSAAKEARATRPTQKTNNFLRTGSRQLRLGNHREAVQHAWEAFEYCDPVMAMNLRGVAEAQWGKSRAAGRSLDFGVEKAREEGRLADTLLWNRALLGFHTDDAAVALQSLQEVEYGEAFPGFFYNLALAQAHGGQYAQALANWDLALEEDPSSAQAWYNRGWTNHRLGRREESLADFERALSGQGPKGHVHLAMSAVLSEKGAFREALQHAEKAYQGHREELPYALAYGQLLQSQGRYAAARKVFSDAVQDFPQSALTHCGLANAFYHLRMFDKAALYYNKALRRNPEMPQALIGRGHVHAHHGRFWEALLDFSLALDYQPGNPYAWEGTGIAHFRLGHYGKAVEAFSQALLENPAHRLSFDAYISQGFAAYHLEKFDEAQTAFEKAISLQPRHPSGYNGLACTYFEMEDFLLAVENFDLAIKYGPADDVVLTNRGNARYRIMDYKGAFSDFGKAVQLNPRNEHAWNGLGICYHEEEDYEKAVEMILEAILIDTTNKDLYINLGVSRGFLTRSLREKGLDVRADTTFELMLADHRHMLDIWADSSVYFINLGYLHAHLDQWDRSMELFQAVDNLHFLKFAENNMGILYALKNQYTRAQALFSQAIARDPDMEYAAPRVNRTLVNQSQGSLSADDPRIIDQISTAQFQKILEKDKYYYTYFYYTLMRYAPPPPEVGFNSPVRIGLPELAPARGQYLLYPSSVECRKVKEVKPGVVRVKKEKRRGVGKGCPQV